LSSFSQFLSRFRPGKSGLFPILIATGVAGISSYIALWVVYRQLGPGDYAFFAIFWSLLYLAVGSLSGVQQEITRSAAPRDTSSPNTPARPFGFSVVLAISVFVLLLLSSFFWGPSIFGDKALFYSMAFAMGASAYVIVAVISGLLYGVSQWKIIGMMISVDAILRLVFLAAGSFAGLGSIELSWLVIVPFVLTPLIFAFIIRQRLVGNVVLDSNSVTLFRNIFATITAAFFAAFIVSVFPALLGFTRGITESQLLGEVIFIVTLARAPIIVVVTAIQSLLLTSFKATEQKERQSFYKLMIKWSSTVVGITVVFALMAFFVGKEAFELLTSQKVSVDGSFFAVTIISSGLVALMIVLASALLAQNNHIGYVAGWATAGIVTVTTLLLPISFIDAVQYAMIVPMFFGLIVQILFLNSRRTSIKQLES